MTPAEAAHLFGKRQGDKLARFAVVFAKAGDKLMVRLVPYFEPLPAAPPPAPAPASPAKESIVTQDFALKFTVALVALGLIFAYLVAKSPYGVFAEELRRYPAIVFLWTVFSGWGVFWWMRSKRKR